MVSMSSPPGVVASQDWDYRHKLVADPLHWLKIFPPPRIKALPPSIAELKAVRFKLHDHGIGTFEN